MLTTKKLKYLFLCVIASQINLKVMKILRICHKTFSEFWPWTARLMLQILKVLNDVRHKWMKLRQKVVYKLHPHGRKRSLTRGFLSLQFFKQMHNLLLLVWRNKLWRLLNRCFHLVQCGCCKGNRTPFVDLY